MHDGVFRFDFFCLLFYTKGTRGEESRFLLVPFCRYLIPPSLPIHWLYVPFFLLAVVACDLCFLRRLMLKYLVFSVFCVRGNVEMGSSRDRGFEVEGGGRRVGKPFCVYICLCVVT